MIAILGAGDQGILTAEMLTLLGHPFTFFDDFETGSVYGTTIAGTFEDSMRFNWVKVLAIANPKTKKQIARQYEDIKWRSVIHPTAVISTRANIGQGFSAKALSIVEPQSVIGQHVSLNSHSIIATACKVGSYVTIATHVCLGFNVTVGEGAFLGMGAKVLPNLHIGEWAVVGAGAVVTKDVPPHTVVVGNPVHPLEKK